MEQEISNNSNEPVFQESREEKIAQLKQRVEHDREELEELGENPEEINKEDCVFCKIINGEIPPGKGKVYENKNFIAILDIEPLIEGHILIISKAHYKTILDLPNTLGTEFIDTIKKTALDLIFKEKAEAFNVLINNFKASGQIVPHLHAHIFPRKKGDGLKVIG